MSHEEKVPENQDACLESSAKPSATTTDGASHSYHPTTSSHTFPRHILESAENCSGVGFCSFSVLNITLTDWLWAACRNSCIDNLSRGLKESFLVKVRIYRLPVGSHIFKYIYISVMNMHVLTHSALRRSYLQRESECQLSISPHWQLNLDFLSLR